MQLRIYDMQVHVLGERYQVLFMISYHVYVILVADDPGINYLFIIELFINTKKHFPKNIMYDIRYFIYKISNGHFK